MSDIEVLDHIIPNLKSTNEYLIIDRLNQISDFSYVAGMDKEAKANQKDPTPSPEEPKVPLSKLTNLAAANPANDDEYATASMNNFFGNFLSSFGDDGKEDYDSPPEKVYLSRTRNLD